MSSPQSGTPNPIQSDFFNDGSDQVHSDDIRSDIESNHQQHLASIQEEAPQSDYYPNNQQRSSDEGQLATQGSRVNEDSVQETGQLRQGETASYSLVNRTVTSNTTQKKTLTLKNPLTFSGKPKETKKLTTRQQSLGEEWSREDQSPTKQRETQQGYIPSEEEQANSDYNDNPGTPSHQFYELKKEGRSSQVSQNDSQRGVVDSPERKSPQRVPPRTSSDMNARAILYQQQLSFANTQKNGSNEQQLLGENSQQRYIIQSGEQSEGRLNQHHLDQQEQQYQQQLQQLQQSQNSQQRQGSQNPQQPQFQQPQFQQPQFQQPQSQTQPQYENENFIQRLPTELSQTTQHQNVRSPVSIQSSTQEQFMRNTIDSPQTSQIQGFTWQQQQEQQNQRRSQISQQNSSSQLRHTIDQPPQKPLSQRSFHVLPSSPPVVYQSQIQPFPQQPIQAQSQMLAPPLAYPHQHQHQTITRTSRIVEKPQSAIPLPVHRQSGSIESNRSGSHPRTSVHFTYASSNQVYPQPQPQLIQRSSVIITPSPPPPPPAPIHTHTVIERTNTVVWQKHYTTVVERYHFVSERFSEFFREFRIITEQLENTNSLSELKDLKMRHTLLLEKLSEAQWRLGQIDQEQSKLEQDLNQGKTPKSEFTSQQYLQLQQHCARLERELQQLRQQENSHSHSHTHSHTHTQEIERYRIELEQYESSMSDLRKYVKSLEDENYKYQQEVKSLNQNRNKTIAQIEEQSRGVIEGQVRIIRELEEQLDRAQHNGTLHAQQELIARQNQTSQSTQITIQNQQITIQSLEQRILELEREATLVHGGGYNQYNASEDQYRRIVETQESIISNLEAQLKELSEHPESIEGYKSNQAELRRVIESHETVISKLRQEVHTLQQNQKSGPSEEEYEKVVANLMATQQEFSQLQNAFHRLEDEKNHLKGQNDSLHREIEQLRRQKVQYQRSMEERLDQKLTLIQQELKMKYTNEVQYIEQSPNRKGDQQRQQQLIQELEQEIDRLSAELRKKQSEKRQLEQSIISQQEGLKKSLMQKDSNLRLLQEQLKLFKAEQDRKLADKDRRIKGLEEELSVAISSAKSSISKNQNTTNVTTTQVVQTNSFEVKNLRDQVSLKDQEIAELAKQKEQLDKKLKSLQSAVNSLEEDLSKKNQEILALKRQASGAAGYESELSVMMESINKKNQEIIELKGIAFEKNELAVELQALKTERTNLKETLKQRQKEKEKLKETIYQLEGKLKGQGNNRFTTNMSLESSSDLQFMEESVRRKETEITKLKQSVHLKDTNIEELEYQVEKLKAKINSTERALAHERETSGTNVSELEARIKQLEAKSRNLDELQRTTRSTFEVEIQNLEINLKQKEDLNKKLQGEIKVLKNKLKNHDLKVQEYNTEIESLNEKIKEVQHARNQLKKQMDGLEESGHLDKNKLYDEYQIKIVELEAAVKMKDNKIKHLENNIQTLKLKINDSGNHKEEDFINQQQIQVLRKKIGEYESRLHSYSQINKVGINGTSSYGVQQKDYDAVRIFENKLIYDLKKENEMLREQASGTGRTNANNQHVDFIQKRLQDFNQRLEDMIRENRELEETGEFNFTHANGGSHTHIQRYNNDQLVSSFERNRNNLIKRHSKEIRAIQIRMMELQRYCSALEGNQGLHSFTSVHQNHTITDNNKVVLSEQIGYYREKNKELEERIDSHIKLNKELKERLESLLKSTDQSNTLDFFKQQNQQLAKQNEEYLLKINLLTEQNKQLQRSLEKFCSDDSAEIKIAELEGKIHELNRRVSQLQMQNGILDADLEKANREAKFLRETIQKLQQSVQEKTLALDKLESGLLKELKTKCEGYEVTITKLTNKVKFMEAEIERLNEVINSRGQQDNIEVSKLKNRINELQQELRSHSQDAHSWSEAEAQYKATIASHLRKISLLEEEIRKLTQKIEYSNKADKDQDSLIQQLRADNSSLQLSLNSLRGDLSLKDGELEQLRILVERLKRERDNDGGQARDRLAYISQIEEQLRQFKLENENLKAAQSRYTQQISSLKQEIESLNREILRLRDSGSEMSSSYSQLEATIKQLRIEIDEEKRFNSQANQEMERLRREIARLEQQISVLRNHLLEIESRMGSYESVMENIAYYLEYIRSSLLESEVLVGEIRIYENSETQGQIQIVNSTRASLNRGLEACSEVFNMI